MPGDISDSQLVDFLAVNVMGWTWDAEIHRWLCEDVGGMMARLPEWYPLTRMTDAWLLVEEMRRRGYNIQTQSTLQCVSWAVFNLRSDRPYTTCGYSEITPDARAICEAVYQTKSKEAGDG